MSASDTLDRIQQLMDAPREGRSFHYDALMPLFLNIARAALEYDDDPALMRAVRAGFLRAGFKALDAYAEEEMR